MVPCHLPSIWLMSVIGVPSGESDPDAQPARRRAVSTITPARQAHRRAFIVWSCDAFEPEPGRPPLIAQPHLTTLSLMPWAARLRLAPLVVLLSSMVTPFWFFIAVTPAPPTTVASAPPAT